MKKIFLKLALKKFLILHNFCYKVISVLAIKLENGVHPKHRILNYHQFFLDNIAPSDIVLDVGCGNGDLSFDLAKKVKKVKAIDLEKKYIAKAKQKNSKENIEYILANVLTYNFQEKFDVVVLSNVLEHIENREEFLKKLKPLAGKLLLRVPLLSRDWLVLYKKEQVVEYRLDKGHFIEYTPEILEKELKASGWRVQTQSTQFGELYIVVVPD